jgi:GT2 family glycosyltransferase
MQNEFTNIGLVTFNRLEYTKQSIESILKTTQSKWKLTVVDNGSTDGTVEYLQKLHGESYIDSLICLESNIGVAKAANIAWLLEPNAGFFVKIDNDIIVRKDCWLFDMINLIKANVSLGLVGYNVENKSYPLIENENGTRLRKTGGNIGGAVVLIPAKTRNLIGYWSEEYGLYGEEDADYSARIKASGLEYAYMEDEDAMFHLPGGKAAEINPTTFVVGDSLENIDFPEYRIWKDGERKKIHVQGGLYERNLIGYQNKWLPLFKPATYSSSIIQENNKTIKNKKFHLVETKIIDKIIKVKYALIFPLQFVGDEIIQAAVKILRTVLENSGCSPDNIIITSVSNVDESSLCEILSDFNVTFNYIYSDATRDELVISAASVCKADWVVVIEPYLVPPAMWVRDIFFIAAKNNWKLVGGTLIETTGAIDHLGYGVNENEEKYEKLFNRLHLGAKSLDNLQLIPSPYFFGIKRESLLPPNKQINGNSLLQIFHNNVGIEFFGTTKIPALKLSEPGPMSNDCPLGNASINKSHTLEKVYENYFRNLCNNHCLSELSYPFGEIGLIFENAKSLIFAKKLFHGEIILTNLDKIISDKAGFWSLVGSFFYEVQMFDKAELAYKHVIDLGIKTKEIYQSLGMAAYSTGRYLESSEYFDHALKLINGDS